MTDSLEKKSGQQKISIHYVGHMQVSLQNDLESRSLTNTVHTLQIHSNKDDTLLHTLQTTVETIGKVLSSTETNLANAFLHPTFIDCTVGSLSYLDDFGVPQDLEDTLDSKLTVDSKVTPAYYSNNRNITSGCDSTNSAYVHFCANDTNTSNTVYDCKILSQGGDSGVDGKGDVTCIQQQNIFKWRCECFPKQLVL